MFLRVMTFILLARVSIAAEPTRQSVFYIDDERVLTISVELEVNSQPLGNSWQESLGAFVESIDADGDGRLSVAEAARSPTIGELRRMQGLPPQPTRASSRFAPRASVDPTKDLARWLERSGFGPFAVSSNTAQQNNATAGFSLFDKLDGNGDGKLSAAELTQGIAFVHKFDIDDDESLSLVELRPFAPPPTMTAGRPNAVANGGAVLMTARTSTERRALGDALFRRFDKVSENGTRRADGKLGRQEIPLPPSVFDQHDIDRNDQLDFEELGQLARKPHPTVTLKVDVGAESPSIELESIAGVALRPNEDDASRATLVIGELALDLVMQELSGKVDAKRIENEFASADTDNNAYITSTECDQAPRLAGLYRLMDANGDGMAFLDEFKSFASVRHTFLESTLVMSASRAGRNLFEIADQDNNGRLAFTELRQLREQINSWDSNGDQLVDQSELPSNYQLAIGPPLSAGASSNAIQSASGKRPLWHERMDRNQDGVVTLREFAGPVDRFRALDTDKDRRLTAIEAVR